MRWRSEHGIWILLFSVGYLYWEILVLSLFFFPCLRLLVRSAKIASVSDSACISVYRRILVIGVRSKYERNDLGLETRGLFGMCLCSLGYALFEHRQLVASGLYFGSTNTSVPYFFRSGEYAGIKPSSSGEVRSWMPL
jgi:hypothetical protein